MTGRVLSLELLTVMPECASVAYEVVYLRSVPPQICLSGGAGEHMCAATELSATCTTAGGTRRCYMLWWRLYLSLSASSVVVVISSVVIKQTFRFFTPTVRSSVTCRLPFDAHRRDGMGLLACLPACL